MRIRYLFHYWIKKPLILTLFLLSVFSSTFSQGFSEYEKKEFPYTLSPYREAALMVGGTSLLYAGAFTQTKLEPFDINDIRSLSTDNLLFFDRWATNQWSPRFNNIRETLEPASIVGSLGFIGLYGLHTKIQSYSWTPFMTLTMMYFEAAYLTEGMVLLSKSLIKRPRPYAYNDNVPMEDRLRSANNESFISGNAAILFFNATFTSKVLSDIFPNKAWVPYFWAGTHSLALLSGYWSVKSGMHFPTDILAGAIWGSGMALLVTHLHKKKTSKVSLTPYGSGAKLLIRL